MLAQIALKTLTSEQLIVQIDAEVEHQTESKNNTNDIGIQIESILQMLFWSFDTWFIVCDFPAYNLPPAIFYILFTFEFYLNKFSCLKLEEI